MLKIPVFLYVQKLFNLYEEVEWLYFKIKNKIPIDLERNSWSMSPKDLRVIIKILKKRIANKNYVKVLEIGAGVSTIIFSEIFKKKKMRLISIEGDKKWFKKISNLLKKYSLKNYVRLIHIPYKNYKKYVWFDKEKIKAFLENNKMQFDIIIVDAPPGMLCKKARAPAIPFLLLYLKNDGIVILHDVKRKDEMEISENWKKYFKKSVKYNTSVGILIFENKNNKETN